MTTDGQTRFRRLVLGPCDVRLPDDKCDLVERRKRGFVCRHEVDELHERWFGVDVRTEALTLPIVLDESRVVHRLRHDRQRVS